ncbi:hypothetical protein HanHA300_Chr07g0244601 [Helianthus annuus]|nr:hypothetical protein HanHA300_Chr07g0244601 [Helianthus annuus]KAJ0563325.1 hypothetical protein HanHA89_Chr07g0261811 [Helianthus annuus]
MVGAFLYACNLWCSHDSLRPLSEPYRAGIHRRYSCLIPINPSMFLSCDDMMARADVLLQHDIIVAGCHSRLF